MKVGILTWFYGANYGAKAQAFALQETVKKMGHDPIMVNYRSPGYRKINFKMNLLGSKDIFTDAINGLIRCYKFNLANTIYEVSPHVHNASEINGLSLDCIILGSDAIFNQNHPLYNDIYYGVGINIPKISFSPSCESLPTSTHFSKEIKTSLREMLSISVRDVNTQELIYKNTGIKPIITLDPTMLYDFKDVTSSFPHSDYILVYTFSEWNEYGALFQKFAKSRKFKIISIGRYCKWADYSIVNANFNEWVTSFRNANMIITDSFHGTVFAIKNQKEFILLSRVNKTEKITSLMEEIKIKKEYYSGDRKVEEYLEQNRIDYSCITTICNAEIDKSKMYLRDSVKKCLQ